MNIRRAVLALAAILMSITSLHSQTTTDFTTYLNQNNTTGLPDYSTFLSSNIDDINLASGSLHVELPVYSNTMRQSKVSVQAVYDSLLWSPLESCGTDSNVAWQTTYFWAYDFDNTRSDISGWYIGSGWKITDSRAGVLTWSVSEFACWASGSRKNTPGHAYVYSNFTYIDSHNTKHVFPNVSIGLRPLVANDCSEWQASTGATIAQAGYDASSEIKLDTSDFLASGPVLYLSDGAKLTPQDAWTYAAGSGGALAALLPCSFRRCCSMTQMGMGLGLTIT